MSGVLARSSSSCLMVTSLSPFSGLWGSWEGNVADFGKVADLGVMRAGKTGRGDFGDFIVKWSRGLTGLVVTIGMVTVSGWYGRNAGEGDDGRRTKDREGSTE